MSVALSFCPTLAASAPRTSGLPANGLALLAASIALAIAVTGGDARPAFGPGLSAPYTAATLVAGNGTSPAALLDAAEAMRARLLSVSGVGAVSLRGLQPGGVDVAYSPARLARFGLTAADLSAALPLQGGDTAPGHLAIAPGAAQSGPQPIADMPVRSGAHVFRVGDVAMVTRTALASPAVTMQQNGRPAVDLLVVPAGGADGSMERRVAAVLTQTALPADIRLK